MTLQETDKKIGAKRHYLGHVNALVDEVYETLKPHLGNRSYRFKLDEIISSGSCERKYTRVFKITLDVSFSPISHTPYHSLDDIKDTLIHELAHSISWGDNDHGSEFQAAYNKLKKEAN